MFGETAHGWTILAHELLLDQLDGLTALAEREQERGEDGPATKLLAHVLNLIFDKVPRDPANSAFRHGGALQGGHREWFRAKTDNGRYRLFYRFHSELKIIVFTWIHDEDSLRTYGSRTDAYAVFADMLESGNPPASWDPLLSAANKKRNAARLKGLRARP